MTKIIKLPYADPDTKGKTANYHQVQQECLFSDDSFVSNILYELWRDYGVMVDMSVDMWAIVSANYGGAYEKPELKVHCACYRVENGLASIYLWFLDNKEPYE